MKTLKILSQASLLAGLFLALTTTESKTSSDFDADNPPNPLDAKPISLTIYNKTDMNIKTTFFSNNKKTGPGKVIDPGKSLVFEVEGRYNKKHAYFRFRKSGDLAKGTGVRFFYKKAEKARGTKFDTIYLLQDNEGNFLVSTTEEINPITMLLKADIKAPLPKDAGAQKHKRPAGEKHKRSAGEKHKRSAGEKHKRSAGEKHKHADEN
jgi:hypothetical protein